MSGPNGNVTRRRFLARAAMLAMPVLTALPLAAGGCSTRNPAPGEPRNGPARYKLAVGGMF